MMATSLCCAMVTFGDLTQPRMAASSALPNSRHKPHRLLGLSALANWAWCVARSSRFSNCRQPNCQPLARWKTGTSWRLVRCGFSYYPFPTFLFTGTQVAPDGFVVAYMTGCDGAELSHAWLCFKLYVVGENADVMKKGG